MMAKVLLTPDPVLDLVHAFYESQIHFLSFLRCHSIFFYAAAIICISSHEVADMLISTTAQTAIYVVFGTRRIICLDGFHVHLAKRCRTSARIWWTV